MRDTAAFNNFFEDMVAWLSRTTRVLLTSPTNSLSTPTLGRVLKIDADHWTIVERSAEVAQALEQHGE